MAHHIYSTPCLILTSTPVGEGNRFLSLFSRDLGLVRAIGKSLREERSKLRYHLCDCSFSEVSLVRGRDVWRIIGAHSSLNIYTELDDSREKQLLIVRTCSLLARLLQGEEPDPILFDMVERGIDFLAKTALDTELVRDFEYMFVIRILAQLGYVGVQKELSALLEPTPFSKEALISAGTHRDRALHVINHALEVSGL